MTPTKEMTAIGDKVKKAKGKSSYYKVAKDAGVTPAMIKNVEDGAMCSVNTLLKVCAAVNLKVAVL